MKDKKEAKVPYFLRPFCYSFTVSYCRLLFKHRNGTDF